MGLNNFLAFIFTSLTELRATVHTELCAVLALGSRIITTHISDHDYVDERHWLPGEGKIDWMRMLAAFETIGYEGVFNYELGNDAAEVKENYEKLFADYNASAAQK